MTASDELFHLIKSLTPSEKRYFKVHASRHVIGKSNHYEKLFDALDALPDDKDYDEAAFKKSLRGKSYGKNLSDEKANLREALLRAMRLYHAERTPKGRLVEMIHEINFLYSKGFVKNCQHQIEKAMKVATDNELYTDIIVLNDFLIRLYRENPTMAPYTVQDMEQQEKGIMQKIAVTREAVYLRMKMTEIQTTGVWTEREAEAKAYMQRAVALASDNDLPVVASILLLSVQQIYFIHHHDYKHILQITMAWMQHAEQRIREIEALNDNYRWVLANYMMCAMHCERMDLLPPAIEKLKNCTARSEKEEGDLFRLSTQYELIYLLNSLKYDGFEPILNQIEAGLKKYKRLISKDQLVNFRFNISLLYFLRKDYDSCIAQIHILHTLSGRQQQYDYTTILARTMEWMCHSSTGNYAILDTHLRSLKRLYSDKDIKSEFTELMFTIYKVIIQEGNKRAASTEDLKKQLSALEVHTKWEQLKAIALSWL